MRTAVKLHSLRADQCPASIRQAIGIQAGVYGIHIDMAGKTGVVDHTDEISPEGLTRLIREAVSGISVGCAK